MAKIEQLKRSVIVLRIKIGPQLATRDVGQALDRLRMLGRRLMSAPLPDRGMTDAEPLRQALSPAGVPDRAFRAAGAWEPHGADVSK